MRLVGALAWILLLLGAGNAALGQQPVDLYGVWQMSSYSRGEKMLDWNGIMVITPTHFSRNYMAANRPLFRDNQGGFTSQEKDAVVEALYRNYAGASGTYRVENQTLMLNPLISGTPGLGPSQRRFELSDDGTRLTLRGTMSEGHVVEEFWERVGSLDE